MLRDGARPTIVATIAPIAGPEQVAALRARARDAFPDDPRVDGGAGAPPIAVAASAPARVREPAAPQPTASAADPCPLRRELAAASYAPATSAELERARVRVTKALRRAIDAIADRSPRLAEHLRSSITTGRRCSYGPADGAPWRVDPGD